MLSKFQTLKAARTVALFACGFLMVETVCAGHTVEYRVSKQKGQTARSRNRVRRGSNNRSAVSRKMRTMPNESSTVSAEPFAAIAREVSQGNSTALRFNGTGLDKQAKGTAQVALRGLKLLVRVRATNLPRPSTFNQQNYLLWVDMPNYGQKLLLGDLPVVWARRKKGRGHSDTAYYYAALPDGAVFGGLMLTAEPKRFLPTPTEPLHLLLVALPPKKDADKLVATSTPATPNVDASSSKKEASGQSKATPQH